LKLVFNIFCAAVSICLILNPAQSQQLGEIFYLGETAFDFQHYGSNDKTIAVDEDNGVHFCWTGGITRSEVMYNYRSPEGVFNWTGGLAFSVLMQTQFATIGLVNDRLAVISYEGILLSGNAITTVSVDQISGGGYFLEFFIEHPDTQLMHPRLVIDSREWIHILAYTPRITDKRALYYNRSENNGLTWMNEWVFIDSVRVLSGGFTASDNGKVALAWGHPINPDYISPLETLNNDIYFVESTDGETWDFANPVNITDFDNGFHPNSDSLRAYKDLSLQYDHINYLHFAYTCAGFWQGGGHSNTCAGSKIYHYCALNGFKRLTGELATGNFPANERRMYDRPSLGFDPQSNDLYCIWNQFNEPGDTSGYGFPNGEIWGAYSPNLGGSWSGPANLSNTPSPGAEPGECQSEDYPSLAAIVNDTLHIAYLFDRDPGGYGIYTSDMTYQKISAAEFESVSGVNPIPGNTLPKISGLICNFPNPFNSSTSIRIEISIPSTVELAIYDIEGRLMEVLYFGGLSAGIHQFTFQADHLSSGIYIARLSGEDFSLSSKMLLLK